MNPYRSGKLVLFQVTYDRDWHFFEILFFIVLGVFGVSFLITFTYLQFTISFLHLGSLWSICGQVQPGLCRLP